MKKAEKLLRLIEELGESEGRSVSVGHLVAYEGDYIERYLADEDLPLDSVEAAIGYLRSKGPLEAGRDAEEYETVDGTEDYEGGEETTWYGLYNLNGFSRDELLAIRKAVLGQDANPVGEAHEKKYWGKTCPKCGSTGDVQQGDEDEDGKWELRDCRKCGYQWINNLDKKTSSGKGYFKP